MIASLDSRLTAPQRSRLVESLFPSGVAAAELRGRADPALLYTEEQDACQGFRDKRLREFAAGRECARYALAQLGYAPRALPRMRDGRVAWPQTATGSISHTARFCAAVATESRRFASLGLDIEHLGDISADLWPQLFRREEIEQLRGLPPAARDAFATVLFCAKEAFYKCQFPLTKRWLDFTDVAVSAQWGADDGGRFSIRLHGVPQAVPGRFYGGFRIMPGFALAGATVFAA